MKWSTSECDIDSISSNPQYLAFLLLYVKNTFHGDEVTPLQETFERFNYSLAL